MFNDHDHRDREYRRRGIDPFGFQRPGYGRWQSPVGQVVVGVVGGGLMVTIAALKTLAAGTPTLYLILYGLMIGVATLAVFSFLGGKPIPGEKASEEARPLGAVTETLDLAGIRIALSGRVFHAVRSAIRDTRGTAKVNDVHALVSTLLGHADAWVFTSLESTPRRPFAQLSPAAARLMDDAIRRFPTVSNVSSQAADPFRAAQQADAVFVVCVVFTSRANISDHKGESHDETRALLHELQGLAGQVHTLDVFVSDLLPIDELAARDPAMRGIA